MKLSEAMNAQKTNTSAPVTQKATVPQANATGKLSTFMASNNIKPATQKTVTTPITNKLVKGSSPVTKNTEPTTLGRVGNTISGAAKDFAGTTMNAIDWASKVPATPLWVVEQYNDAFSNDVLGKTADKLMGSGAKDIAQAKNGASELGKTAIDVGVGGLQLAGDIGLAALTGGSSIAPMVARSFGSAAKQAENSGGSELEQALYGGLTAGTTALVGKLANVGGILSKAYGKGVLDNTLQKATSGAIGKLVKNGVISDKIATGIAAGAGEGFEEMLESTLSPLYQKISYDPNAKWNAEQILYDGLVGAIVGGLAGGMGGSNSSNNSTSTAQTGANNAQLNTPNVQNGAVNSTLTPNLNANKPNVNVQENVSVPNAMQNAGQIQPNIVKPTQSIAQESAQAPISDITTKPTTDTGKAAEAKQSASEVKMNEEPQSGVVDGIKDANLKAKVERDINSKAWEKAFSEMGYKTLNDKAIAENEYQKDGDSLLKAVRAKSDFEILERKYQYEYSHDNNFVKSIINQYNAKENQKSHDRIVEDSFSKPDWQVPQSIMIERVDAPWKNDTIIKEHKQSVVDALNSGEDVPSEVLKDYPDLATKSTSLFPENSLGAKITKGMPQGTGAASANSLGGMGATKPTRFAVNDETNSDLNNLPPMSNQVVMTPQKKSLNVGQKLSKAYTRIVDVLNPIVKFSKATGDNTAMLASNAVNAGGTVSHIIENSLVDMNGNKIGKSLKEITAKIPKGQEVDFWNYMLQRRNIFKALEDKNVIASYNSRMSTQYVKNVEAQRPEWKNTGDSIVKWITDFQQAWGVDSGLIDSEVFKQMNLRDQSYIPAQREFSELESALTGGEVGRKFIDQNSPIKKMEGSDRDINNPLENIMKLVNTTVKTARYNQVGQSLLKTLRRNPKASQYGEIISAEEASASRANNIVTVIENGQKQYIRINDIDLLESLNGMPKSTYTVPVVSNLVTGFKKITTQDNPLFGITNLARDLPTGYIYGSQRNPFTYLLNEGKAFGQIATNGEMAQRYKAVGGGISSFFSSANAETAALNLNKTQNVFKKVGVAFNKFNSMIEEATRLNEFSYVLGKTGDVQKALAAANDVTVNFARGGDIIKTVDRNGVPYLNASIQGLDKLGKAFKPDRIAKTLFTGAVGITLPTLILYMFNRDNPYYDELSNRTKDAYFVIPNTFGELDDNGTPMTFFKLPKSRELGMIFGALAERIARAVDGEEEAFKGFAGTIATNISPANPIDSGLVGPIIGLRSNKDFAGRTIVPQSMQDRSAHLQFDEKTSELTKFIAEYASKVGIEWSPKEMDYLIDSWTGVVGDFLLPATTKGASALSPITNKFTADPRYSSQTIANFYEKMDEAAKMANDKNFAEGLDSETVTLEEKISSNYVKASKEISALSKISSRTLVNTLTGEDKDLLQEYGISITATPQEIQKAIRTEQNKIASEAIARGTKADEMELDLNNNSDISKSVAKYQSAGITQKQAYSVYKAFESLEPLEGETEVSTYQKIKAISGFGYTDKQAIALAGTLYTSSDKTSMLPYLTTSKHLLSLYLTNKDSEMISMTVPSTVTKSGVEYELTDKEKEIFQNTYANYFNSRATNLTTATDIKSLRDKAFDAAKTAVINSR